MLRRGRALRGRRVLPVRPDSAALLVPAKSDAFSLRSAMCGAYQATRIAGKPGITRSGSAVRPWRLRGRLVLPGGVFPPVFGYVKRGAGHCARLVRLVAGLVGGANRTRGNGGKLERVNSNPFHCLERRRGA